MRILRAAIVLAICLVPSGASALPSPANSITCAVYFGVVFPPTPISQVSSGHGVFGSTVGLPSGISCTGSIVGTATITGVASFCPPKGTNEAECPARVGVAPDTAPVWTTLNTTGPASLFASVYAEGVLTPDPGTGLRYADDPGLARGLVTCTIVGQGVGSAVITLAQHTTLVCQGSNEASSHRYTGVSNLLEQPLLGPAGNLVTSTEPGFEQLCPDPLVTLNPADLECFRSVLLQGEMTLTEPGVV